MKYLPPAITFIILRFSGPNAIYLNKELIAYTDKIKKEFEEAPLVVQYQLQRMKEKVNAGRANTYSVGHRGHYKNARCGRTSIYVEKPRKLRLSGGLPLGYLKADGSINYSKQLKDKIIPASFLKYCSQTCDSYKVTYWEIERVWVSNIKRTKLYCCLFGCC